MDRYLTAISANDLEAMGAMQTAEGMTYRALSTEGGEMEIVAHPNSYWVDPSQDDGHAYRERYWRVSNSMWTVEPNACAELRPKEGSVLRPAG